MDKTAFVCSRPNEKFYPDCIVETIKHPTLVVTWSIICGQVAGCLYKVVRKKRQDQHKEVLENQLLPQMEDWSKIFKNLIFMQDDVTSHTEKSLIVYLKQKKIDVLPWSGNSPYLAGKPRDWKRN